MNASKELIRKEFSHHYENYHSLATTQKNISAELGSLLFPLLLQPKKIFEIGCGTGFLTQILAPAYPQAEWILNDLSQNAATFIKADDFSHPPSFLPGDAEELDYPTCCDLIATASTLQWFHDTPAFFQKAYTSLNSGGLLALATFGPHNFHELRALTGIGLPYLSKERLIHQAEQTGFFLLSEKEYLQEIAFPSMRDLLHYVKHTGLNAIQHEPLPFRKIKSLMSSLEEKVEKTQGFPLTYHPILLILKK